MRHWAARDGGRRAPRLGLELVDVFFDAKRRADERADICTERTRAGMDRGAHAAGGDGR
jgi:hypothetical protein